MPIYIYSESQDAFPPTLSRLIAELERGPPPRPYFPGYGGDMLSLTIDGYALLRPNDSDDEYDDDDYHEYLRRRYSPMTPIRRLQEQRDHSRRLQRFVEVLEGHRGVEAVTFKAANLEEDGIVLGGAVGSELEATLAQLFGSVLPRHPTIRSFTFLELENASRFLSMFLRGIAPAAPPLHAFPPLPPDAIAPTTCAIDFDGVRDLDTKAIGSMLRRSGAVRALTLRNCEIGGAGLQDMMEGLEGNTTLEYFCCSDPTVVVDGDAISAATAKASPLRHLIFHEETWTLAGLDQLFVRLRSNATLERLYLTGATASGPPDLLSPRIDELLSAYNWTLRSVTVPNATQSPHGDRNANLRTLYRAWEDNCLRRRNGNGNGNGGGGGGGGETSAVVVLRPALMPRLLGALSCKPTLLYRVLRCVVPPLLLPNEWASLSSRPSPAGSPEQEASDQRDRKRPQPTDVVALPASTRPRRL